MFEWSTSYATGIGTIDAQHQMLFQIAGKLHEAMGEGQGKAALNAILDRLLQYTESHFAHEERLLSSNNYPDLAAHKAKHAALCQQVREFQARYRAGQSTLTIQVLQFLKSWLVEHIQKTDLQYVPFVTRQSVA